jgi:hypothetical protein
MRELADIVVGNWLAVGIGVDLRLDDESMID